MALRWMAGGDKMDIAPHPECSFDEVMKSVWAVVDAVNTCDKLKMRCPKTYAEQVEVAEGFKKNQKPIS